MTPSPWSTLWRTAAAALTLAAAAPAPAQGPEGNQHPPTHAITDIDARNPFGDAGPTPFDGRAKADFARHADLSPLRDLAVFHNGRVKIVETLARETIGSILGRKDFIDLVRDDKSGRVTKVRYDPVFTFFDMMIDPAFYDARAVLHVNYLPLRERLLEKLYNDPAERDWWLRHGHVKPADWERVWASVAREAGADPRIAEAMDRVEGERALLKNSWKNLLMVAPDASLAGRAAAPPAPAGSVTKAPRESTPAADLPWIHLSRLEPGSPAGRAVADLAAAWRARDAERANAAARDLARELPLVHADLYPTTSRQLESAYNRANPFTWGYWLYALSLLGLLLAFGTGRRWLVWIGILALAAALALHFAGFAARCVIAERYAIQNQFESMTGLALFAVIVGVVLMALRRQWLFGAAAAGVGLMALIAATETGIPGQRIEREAAILNTSALLKYHVTTVLMSYGLIALGFVVSCFYLGTHYLGRRQSSDSAQPPAAALDVSAAALGLDDSAPRGVRRVLADLDAAQIIVLKLAFIGLMAGIFLGAWWADHSWGRWWGFDAKEVWALITWMVYLVVVHARQMELRNRALVTAWLSVLGFLVMLWTYFGVNLLLPGLHAYA